MLDRQELLQAKISEYLETEDGAFNLKCANNVYEVDDELIDAMRDDGSFECLACDANGELTEMPYAAKMHDEFYLTSLCDSCQEQSSRDV